MKRDTLVLFVALGCGLAAFGLISNYLRQAAQPKNQFVMAAKALKKGHIITEADLKISSPMQNIKAEDHFTQMHEVIGMRLEQNVAEQKLIPRTIVKKVKQKKPEIIKTVEKVIAENNPVLPVPPSMRALTFSMSELESLPKGLKGGQNVDVLGSVAVVDSSQREIRTLLRAALVLSVQKGLKGEQEMIESVTIAVSPPNVEMILNALKMGKMRLLITPQADDKSNLKSMESVEVIRGVLRERKVT